jgi:hypothetical protein
MSTPQYTEDVHILEGDELVTNLPPIVAQPGVDWVNQLFGGGDSDACNRDVADDSKTFDPLEGDNPQLPHSQLPRPEDPIEPQLQGDAKGVSNLFQFVTRDQDEIYENLSSLGIDLQTWPSHSRDLGLSGFDAPLTEYFDSESVKIYQCGFILCDGLIQPFHVSNKLCYRNVHSFQFKNLEGIDPEVNILSFIY